MVPIKRDKATILFSLSSPTKSAVLFALYATLLGLTVSSLYINPVTHDVGWYLYLSGRVLKGEVLYQDLIDVNPPFIVWLNLPVVALSERLNLPSIQTFLSAVLFTGIAVLLWCRRLLRRLFGDERLTDILVLSTAAVVLILPSNDFGEREHLALLFVLPYVLIAGMRCTGQVPPTSSRVAAASLAAIGLSLKPYFLLSWIAVELAVLWHNREGRRLPWKEPENITIASFVLLEIGIILLLAPSYPTQLLKLGPLYTSYPPSGARYGLWWGLLALPSPLCFALLRQVLSRPARALGHILSFATLGFTLEALIQQKGWTYHFYPAWATSVLLGILLIVAPVPAMSPERFLRYRAVAAGIVVAFTVNAVRVSLSTMLASETAFDRVLRIVSEEASGETVLAFSSELGVGFPLVNYADALWGMRFPSLWFVASLYGRPGGPQGSMIPFRTDRGTHEQVLFEAVVSDFLASKPELLLVDRRIRPDFRQRAFDYLAYYSTDPRFREELVNYRSIAEIEGIRILRRVSGETRTEVPSKPQDG